MTDDFKPTYCEEVLQVREQTYREEEELTATPEEIDAMIEEYGFRLDEEDPENGGFLCDYFPSLEEDPELQRKILYNQYHIYQTLLARYKDELEKLTKEGADEASKKRRLKDLFRRKQMRDKNDPSSRLRVIK